MRSRLARLAALLGLTVVAAGLPAGCAVNGSVVVTEQDGGVGPFS